ncbi:MAG: serine hydrolase domain-containing protein [Rhizomicrobium sp.]
MKRLLSTGVLLALACAAFVSASAQSQSNREVLNAWLKAYNAGDDASLMSFEQKYFGDSNIAFAHDSREETGGLELVKIESEEPLKLSALLKEHDSAALWEATLTRTSADAAKLSNLAYRALPMPQAGAVAALDTFASKLDRLDKFSGVLLVKKGNTILFRKAFGLADRASGAPVTLDTRFYFASQGKMFTAVSVLQLVADGKVSLDDPIGKYLTDYPNAEVARKVTVRELLTHRGGTGEMSILEAKDTQNRAWVRSISDIIKLNGARGPAFEPGTKMDYSNYGFILLGALVEKVSGKSYYDYVDSHIFKPAGMLHTSFPLREEPNGIAIGYTQADGKLVSSMDQLPWRGTPAGGGVSTADDMARFVSALNAGKLLSPAMLTEATKVQSKWYGYGFITSGLDGFPYWGHGGGAPGNSLVLDYYPVTDTTFVCMANRDPPVCDRLAFNWLFRSPKAP